MQKRETIWLGVILACAVLSGASRATAQDTASGTKATPQSESSAEGRNKAPAAQRMEDEAYHIEFSINELEDGRKINSRQYSTDLTTAQPSEIKIGARVPAETNKEGEFEYMDVGTSIFAQVRETSAGQRILVVRTEVSSFAVQDANQGHDSRPIVRQMKMGGSALLPLAKTTVMGSADDPSSKRQFQLEVTVTKLH